ncbi:hypothetical protein BH09MYX1_BH09MYX1_34710 [soil metagenome]
MMLLSRFWYAILAVLAAFAVYAIFLAVGQYNRRSTVASNESLAADSQVVRWSLQIDSRRRLDALLVGSVDKGVQDACVATIDKEKMQQKSRDDGKKALAVVMDKIAKQYRPDALFLVDRDGRLIAQVGYDKVNPFEDFELGGYAAVNDALHGWLRDDVWLWNEQLYMVSARPVEFDVTQAPAGALVALRAIDRVYAQELSKQTNTNVVFYANGKRSASASMAGFDEGAFDQVIPELGKLDADADYKSKGHTDTVRDIGPTKQMGAVFARLDGEAFELGAGYAVVRTRVFVTSPGQFLSGADDTDKKSVNLGLIAAIIVFGILFGVGLTFLEHDRPLKVLVVQAQKLKKGELDLLQPQNFSGNYRDVAMDLNAGIERVADKGGGAPRKTADLESILGPVAAQPAMSAFSFPLADQGAAPMIPQVPPASAPRPGFPSAPGDRGTPPPPTSGPRPAPPPAIHHGPPPPTNPGLQQPLTSPTVVQPMKIPMEPSRPAIVAAPISKRHEDEEEQTMVAAIPQEVMARASGQHDAAQGEDAEWPSVYEEFVRTKKQCGEPTEGLTFEKFRQTLKKNRDALVQRHACKRVKFSVYVKDGRASLKATPVKD